MATVSRSQVRRSASFLDATVRPPLGQLVEGKTCSYRLSRGAREVRGSSAALPPTRLGRPTRGQVFRLQEQRTSYSARRPVQGSIIRRPG